MDMELRTKNCIEELGKILNDPTRDFIVKKKKEPYGNMHVHIQEEITPHEPYKKKVDKACFSVTEKSVLDDISHSFEVASKTRTIGQYLQDIIEKKEITKDSSVYHPAGISQTYWGRLINDKIENPRKDKLLAISVGLKLTVSEAETLLNKSGYTFNQKDKRDVIIEYFLKRKLYDTSKIDEVLVSEDYPPLFCVA